MKKLFFLLASAALLSFPLHAQRFHAGFTAGVTVTDIPGMDARDGDLDFNKLGLVGGGIVSTQLNEQNDLQFEINYIQKGSSQRPDSLNNGQFRLSLDYIEVPLVFRHRMNIALRQRTVKRFGFEAGISIAQLVRFKEVANNYPQTVYASYFNKTEVSLLAGVDCFLTDRLMFSLRYSNSVIPAVKRNGQMPGFYLYTFNQGNNMVFQLAFKFIFGETGNAKSDVVHPQEDSQPQEN